MPRNMYWPIHFNPLGRKTETTPLPAACYPAHISIHSVARPRQGTIADVGPDNSISIHSVARPRLHVPGRKSADSISIHSVARPRLLRLYFDYQSLDISIHSVARPRLDTDRPIICSINFNPLGRKTETTSEQREIFEIIFQSTRSQDRDFLFRIISLSCIFQSTRSQDRDPGITLPAESLQHFNPLGRKTETRNLNNTTRPSAFQSTRSQDRDQIG